ncbi:MAG TPA: cellulase family glycosylhydrolase [Vicinamibacterales bacterium]|nr:cellulase family glycosylhydrolase [Vicinamibacterales bacterium]
MSARPGQHVLEAAIEDNPSSRPVVQRLVKPVLMRSLRLVLLLAACSAPAFGQSPSWVAVSETGDGFVLSNQRAAFIPWGFNYFRDERFRLLEDYWNGDGPDGWPKIERDLREMKRLGANVVRVSLQFARFMDAPRSPNQISLARLEKLIGFAEDVGVYLDVTGLGTFRVADEPSWYRNLTEKERWASQAAFWEAVAAVGANRPGVFAYNVMNEPLVSTTPRRAGEWTHPAELEGMRYLEYINLDPAGRRAPDIARAWLRQMTQAIRRHDQRHPITVGMIWIDNAKPENMAGFPPADIALEVDFLAVHVYPASGQVDVALDSLARYRKGKPVVVEETFPLNCTPAEYADFLRRSRGIASGWLAHFWSLTPEDLKGRTDAASGLMLESLNVFQSLNPNR